MVGKKICLTVSEKAWNELNQRALLEGFSGVPALVRHLAITSLNESKGQTSDKRYLKISVDNYRELAGYVAEKKFGKVEHFATYAMESYMSKYPLTRAQSERVAKLVD